MKYSKIPAEVVWRKEIVSEILLAREEHLVVENFSYDELNLIWRLSSTDDQADFLLFLPPLTFRVDVSPETNKYSNNCFSINSYKFNKYCQAQP